MTDFFILFRTSLKALQPSSLFIYLTAVLLLTGCSTSPQSNSSQQTADRKASIDSLSTTAEQLPSKPFAEDTLLNLLIGEMAVYERDINTAATNYHREALITKDVAIVERAAKLARYQRNAKSALELAELWYELAPDNDKAAENLADMYARTNRPLDALGILEMQTSKGVAANFGVLRNSKFTQGDDKLNQVLERLSALNEKKSHKNFSLIFSHTLLLQKNGENEAALRQLKKLRNFESDPVQLALIESQLLSELKRDKEASEVLHKAVKKYPEKRHLQAAYARKLTKTDLPKAENIFKALLVSTPNDPKLLMPHALVAAENKHYEAAKQSLDQLITSNQELDFSHYNLGLIAEKENHHEMAIDLLKRVGNGEHFLPATNKILQIHAEQQRIDQARSYLLSLREGQPLLAPNFWIMESNLLRDNQQVQEAHNVLSLAITQFPQQQSLRIERSYLSDTLNNIVLVEEDLRFVLQREPKNPMALNALGYILADRTERYEEALQLIKQAVELMPSNAAILDSLGWVQYKMGNVSEAENNLTKAFDDFPDDEIAAHLIEIYWQSNRKDSARKIYKRLRKENKDHPKVDNVIETLNIDF